MERTIVLLHEGFLAYYSISEDPEGSYMATLQKYCGLSTAAPPAQFELHKMGRHWQDDGHDQDLINEMGKAIDLIHRKEGPVDPDRARSWGKDIGSF